MKKNISRIIGVIMLIVAIVFIVLALNHPEKSFPWNNTITWLLYGIYSVSYTHLRAHETRGNLVCRLLLEKKK